MYVYELAKDGVLAFEAGLPGENGEPPAGEFPPAVLLAVNGRYDKGTELAAGQLSQPGGIIVDWSGRIYVTDWIFSGGRLLQVIP